MKKDRRGVLGKGKTGVDFHIADMAALEVYSSKWFVEITNDAQDAWPQQVKSLSTFPITPPQSNQFRKHNCNLTSVPLCTHRSAFCTTVLQTK
jgi:hypothetical protein